MPGASTTNCGLGSAGDLDFCLPHAHSFDQNALKASGVEQVDDIICGKCQTAEAATGCHAAHKDAAIPTERTHARTVAKQSAAGKGAGGINCNDGDCLAMQAITLRHYRHQCRFASARRAGDADDMCLPRVRKEQPQGVRMSWSPDFRQSRDCPRQRKPIACKEFSGQGGGFEIGHGQSEEKGREGERAKGRRLLPVVTLSPCHPVFFLFTRI